MTDSISIAGLLRKHLIICGKAARWLSRSALRWVHWCWRCSEIVRLIWILRCIRIIAVGIALSLREQVPVPSSFRKFVDTIILQGGKALAGEVTVSGAKNAALLAAAILATSDDTIRQKLEAFRRKQAEAVLAAKLPR